MKKSKKYFLWNILILFLLTLVVIFLYGFLHELTHFTTCEIIGLDGKIEINLFVDPPVYSMNCEGINEKNIFQKFSFWGSPYFVSLIIMIFFFIYLDKKRFYLVGLPLGIAFNDAMNIFGLYEWTYKTGNLGNDLFNILFKTSRGYYYLLFLVLGLTFFFFVLNLLLFYKELLTSQTLTN